jgi:hypothetical protein
LVLEYDNIRLINTELGKQINCILFIPLFYCLELFIIVSIPLYYLVACPAHRFIIGVSISSNSQQIRRHQRQGFENKHQWSGSSKPIFVEHDHYHLRKRTTAPVSNNPKVGDLRETAKQHYRQREGGAERTKPPRKYRGPAR